MVIIQNVLVEKKMCDYIVKVLIIESATECLHLSRLQRNDNVLRCHSIHLIIIEQNNFTFMIKDYIHVYIILIYM